MKIISSRDTWYLIFAGIFIFIVAFLAYRFISKNTERKLESLSTKQTTRQVSKLSAISSPSPSPAPTGSGSPTPTSTTKTEESETKRRLSLLGFSPLKSTSPVEKAEKSEQEESQETPVATQTAQVVATGGTNEPTKGGQQNQDLEIITTDDGTTFVGTRNADGSEDEATSSSRTIVSRSGNLFSAITLPEGFATDPISFINSLLRMVLVISALLTFLYLIWGGIDWITSGGDKAKGEAARSKITAAVIGLIIVASSYAVLQLSLNFLGIESINSLLGETL